MHTISTNARSLSFKRKEDFNLSSPKIQIDKNCPQSFVNVISNKIEDVGEDEIDGCVNNFNGSFGAVQDNQCIKTKILKDDIQNGANSHDILNVSSHFQLSGLNSFDKAKSSDNDIRLINIKNIEKKTGWPQLVKTNILESGRRQTQKENEIIGNNFENRNEQGELEYGKEHEEFDTNKELEDFENVKEHELFVNGKEQNEFHDYKEQEEIMECKRKENIHIEEHEKFVDDKDNSATSKNKYEDDENISVNIDVIDNDVNSKSKEHTVNIEDLSVFRTTEKDNEVSSLLTEKVLVCKDHVNNITGDDVTFKENLNLLTVQVNINENNTAEKMDYLDIGISKDIFPVLTDILLLSGDNDQFNKISGNDTIADINNQIIEGNDMLTYPIQPEELAIHLNQNIGHKKENSIVEIPEEYHQEEEMIGDDLFLSDICRDPVGVTENIIQAVLENDEGIALDDETKSCKSTNSSDTGYASNRELSPLPSPVEISPTNFPFIEQQQKPVLVIAKKSNNTTIRSDDQKGQILKVAEESEFIQLGSFTSDAYFVEDIQTKKSTSGRTRRKQLEEISRKKPVISVKKSSVKEQPVYKAELNKIQCKAYRLKRRYNSEKMQNELGYLLTVNQELKMKLASLQKEKDSLYQIFQSYIHL